MHGTEAAVNGLAVGSKLGIGTGSGLQIYRPRRAIVHIREGYMHNWRMYIGPKLPGYKSGSLHLT